MVYGVVKRKRFRTIKFKDKEVRANARARSEHRDNNVQVVVQGLNFKNKSKRNLSSTVDSKISAVERRKADAEAKMKAVKSVIVWRFIMSHCCECEVDRVERARVNMVNIF